MNYYEILEIRENASQEVIRASYKILAQKYHPDKNKTEEAAEKMKLINVAYSILSDEEKKKKYDFSLSDQKRRKQELEEQEKMVTEKAKQNKIIAEENKIVANGREVLQDNFYAFSFEINKKTNFLILYFWFKDKTFITINTKETFWSINNLKFLEDLEKFYKHKMIVWFISKITENKGFNYNNIFEFTSTGIYLLSDKPNENEKFIKYEDLVIEKKFNREDPFFIIKSNKNNLIDKLIISSGKDNINSIVLLDVFDFLKNHNPILKQFTRNEKKYYKSIEKTNKQIEKENIHQIKQEEKEEQKSQKKLSFKRNFNFKTLLILSTYFMVVFFVADFILNFTSLDVKGKLNFNQTTVKNEKKKEELIKSFEIYKKSGDFKNLYKEFLGFSESGDVRIYNYLGIMRINGWGVEKNIDEAIKWFSLSANKKDIFAKSQLGSIYLFGYGVNKNYFLAKNYLTEASEGDDINAINNLGVMYANGLGVDIDKKKALFYFQKGIDKNNPVSLFNAALIIKDQNSEKYKEYIKKAAAMNFDLAKKELSKFK